MSAMTPPRTPSIRQATVAVSRTTKMSIRRQHEPPGDAGETRVPSGCRKGSPGALEARDRGEIDRSASQFDAGEPGSHPGGDEQGLAGRHARAAQRIRLSEIETPVLAHRTSYRVDDRVALAREIQPRGALQLQ